LEVADNGAAFGRVAGRLDFDCDVLTGEPDVYHVLGDDPPIIGI
jgi:hypothetical protein